jgi:G3E family GTPase
LEKLKVNVIGGFLGSGKTTLLRHFLAQPKLDEKVAVIVNELGEIGIDGRILERSGSKTMELTNGCVCCQVTGDMIQAVKDIRAQYKPDRLLIETTGVAEPGKVLTVLYSPYLSDEVRVEPTCVVVDAAGFEKLYKELAYHYVMQIKAADLIVLNKMDLVTPARATKVEAEIRRLNPKAFVMRAQHGRVDLLKLLEGREGGAPPEDDGRPGERFESFAVREAGIFDKTKLEKFLSGLPSNCYRAKGFVRAGGESLLVNAVTGQVEWEPWPDEKTPEKNELVFIGRKLPKDKLIKDLKRCLSTAKKSKRPSSSR